VAVGEKYDERNALASPNPTIHASKLMHMREPERKSLSEPAG